MLLLVRSPNVLVDLTEHRDDIYDPNKKVVSRYNYSGKGKLSPKDGQHLAGELNPITKPESSSLSKPSQLSPRQSPKNGKRIELSITDNGDILYQKNKIKGENFYNKALVTEKKNNSQDKMRLAVDTEDSLENKFWFKESEFLQISTRSHPDAEFSIELANLLKKRFATYVMGGGALNFYHVKRDQATVLASVNSFGEINFKKMIESSETQPYMNYLVTRVVDNPGIVKHLPAELSSQEAENLDFLFNIRFTGEPLRKWWMSFEFLPDTF